MPLPSSVHLFRGSSLLAGVVALIAVSPSSTPVAAEPPAQEPLAAEYEKGVKPLLAKYCVSCHGAKEPEADLDLGKFATLADVRKATKVWQRAGEMIDGGQMPPKDSPQPSEAERATLQTWVRTHLKTEAKAHAGDPGRVTLRRLSNAEYTYTLRDLTGVESLDPAREFPVDGAAGEGFTNSGDALVMSPALLTKYLDAAKGVAAHAVLLPDGIRFSPSTTRRDHTNEILDRIRALYGTYTDSGNGTQMNLQGVVFNEKEGGRLPLEKYLAATIADRDALAAGTKTPAEVAQPRGLSAGYLALVWKTMTEKEPSLLLDGLRARWATAKPDEANALAADFARWQKVLWRANPVGHIGKVGGPKAWMEAVDPLVTKQEVRFKLPPAEGDQALYLTTTAAGGVAGEAVWQRPRFVSPGKPDLLLKDVRTVSAELIALRTRALADTAKYLAAADEAAASAKPDADALAKTHGLEADALRAWLDCLGVTGGGKVEVTGHFTGKIEAAGEHKFIQGWGTTDTPQLLANSSDTEVRIPGTAKPHGVVVHPSSKLNVIVGWQSPVSGAATVTAKVQHAHVACGNGVEWAVEHRQGGTRQRLSTGFAQGQTPAKISVIDKLEVKAGDLLSVVVGPRNGDHSCDLTAVDLTITADGKTWDLAKDVTGDILTSNPHADGFKNPGVWHFYTEPTTTAGTAGFMPPKGSVLDRWRSAKGEVRTKLATEVQALLTAAPPAAKDSPDSTLHKLLTSLGGPLFGNVRDKRLSKPVVTEATGQYGLDAKAFNAAGDLLGRAAAVVEVKVPAELVAGYEFVATGALPADSTGVAQLQVSTAKPAAPVLQQGGPLLVAEAGPSRKAVAAALEAFRDTFPPAACYAKIVPVDEVVTLTLFYREDHQFARLLLDDARRQTLDRLWDELHYVSRDAITQVDAFKQLLEFASQDGDPKLFEPLRKPIMEKAAAFRQRLTDTEPKHLDATLAFAAKAYRRPLTTAETSELTALYRKLRSQEVPHDEAIRLTLARVLVAPAFLYKLETPGPAATAAPVNDWELATRLSYFLWSSAPDDELRTLAAAGKLHEPDVLAAQTKRMLTDPRVRRLAVEFACQWLHVRNFDQSSEKSEKAFPTFPALKAAMYEESVQVFADLFRSDRPVTDLFDSDATFLNDALAKHYDIPGVTGPQWRRVEGVRKYGRGGILGLSTTLSAQSGASRTSPILRGNWVSEVLLGEKLPRPPKGVPQLPEEDSKDAALSVRQLTEKHTSDPKCAGCHKKIDSYGYALEAFDGIGRRRSVDAANRPIDTKAKTADGAEFDGIDGLRNYLMTKRKDAVIRQFCKKLLGYSLGRSVMLSDEPLLDDMQAALAKDGYRVAAAIDRVVHSRQFRDIRGSKFPTDE